MAWRRVTRITYQIPAGEEEYHVHVPQDQDMFVNRRSCKVRNSKSTLVQRSWGAM
jgi:hypothetical protein